MPFGMTVDEDLVFNVSLGLLSLLALLWIFNMVVILWLRKIQRRVDKATNALTSISINSWSPTNTLNAFAYSAEHINEDGKDLGQTSFECVEAKRENDETETPSSSSEHSEIANGRQSKHYSSLKDHRSIKYEKVRDSEKTPQNLTNTEDFVYSTIKYEAVRTPPHNPSKQTHVLIGDDKAQSTEHHRVKPQHSGETSAIVANNTVEGYIEAEADASQYDYENEYLAIIHTEGMSPEGPYDTIENVLCQENEYLMPIETAETETRQGKYNNVDSEENKTKVSQPADLKTRKESPGREAHSTTRATGQDSGIGCSGDAPIHENPDFGNASDFPIYANEKTSKTWHLKCHVILYY